MNQVYILIERCSNKKITINNLKTNCVDEQYEYS